jgi:homoserine kinase type II
MSDVVHLLWFAKEMPEGEDDIELLIGVYSSDGEASAAIERMKDKPGFAEFSQGFEVCPYSLDRDHWMHGFVLDGKRALLRSRGQ